MPHGDVAPWSVAAGCLLIIEEETPAAPLLGVGLLTALYMEMATTTLSSPCGGRRAHVHSAAGTELSFAGKGTREVGASPGLESLAISPGLEKPGP